MYAISEAATTISHVRGGRISPTHKPAGATTAGCWPPYVLVVDRKGLARKLGRRSKAFLVFELLQNAWDEDITFVDVTMEMLPGRPACRIVVADDCPEGFVDLASVYTMFRDSKKAGDPTKRGRFELGEKLVLALALEAKITSTKGTIIIEDDARRATREKTEKGTIFSGVFRMSREEYDVVCRQIRQVIPPPGIVTTFNGAALEARPALHTFDTTLQTIRIDAEGNLSPTQRKTPVEVFEVREGATAHIYEMGLPVVDNVAQRVPVNWERNNVPPSYMKTLRVEVLNAMHDKLTKDDASAAWVSDAAEDPRAATPAVEDVVTKRFGEKSVIYDPSDPEGSKLAVSKGYTVIPGGALSQGFWQNIRRDNVRLPAGQVTPSPKTYDPNGRPENVLPESAWSDDMRAMARFAAQLFGKLTGEPPCSVYIVHEPGVWWRANFGTETLCLNYAKLGKAWFAAPHRDERVLSLLVHEFGHHYSADHLDAAYHKALTQLAAKLANLALEEPGFFGAPEER
jgi:hypothetical protein